MLFQLLAVGLRIKKLVFVRVVGVRGAFRSRRGAIFAHGSYRSMCNFRIGDLSTHNPVGLCLDVVRLCEHA